MRLTSALTAIVILASGRLYGIDPSPNLLKIIADGKIAPPYYMQQEARLRALGVESPNLWRLQKTGGQSSTQDAMSVPTGDWNALVLLVDFPDTVSQTEPAFFDSLVYSSNGPSVQDYFLETSYGRLTITTVSLPSATGWTTASQPLSYYVDGQNGFGTYPRNVPRLVEDVVLAVDSLIDFSLFDNDGDLYVDALFVVHAGRGAEWTGSNDHIWSHAWTTNSEVAVDSVNVYRYAMEPEYWEAPGDMTLGVFAHELAHAAFNVPDMYDYDDPEVGGSASRGLGFWSLLSSGVWLGPGAGVNLAGSSPALPDAWSRIRMGYGVPLVISADAESLALAPATVDSTIYRLWTSGSGTGDQYYLVENRQKLGYDSYLFGSGMLIYYIDEAMAELGNDIQWVPGDGHAQHYSVALMQADGQYHLERNIFDSISDDGGDSYPGLTGNRAFNDYTSPSARTYAGALSGISITAISDTGDTVWADYRFGTDQPDISIVSFADHPDDDGMQLDLSWSSLANDTAQIESYMVWIRDSLATGLPSGYRRYLNDGPWFPYDTIDATGAPEYFLTMPSDHDSSAADPTPTIVSVSVIYIDGQMMFSEAASGSSIDNLPPDSVKGLTVELVEKGILLTWLPIETDLLKYGIFMSESLQQGLGGKTFVDYSWDTTYTVKTPSVAGTYYFTVAAIDQGLNWGVPAEDVSVIILGVDGPESGLPARFALHPNHPNPFNPSTVIPFDVAQAGVVTLTVHDLAGRQVSRLIDQRMAAGSYRAVWKGLDSTGRSVPSGIYFVRMTAGSYAATQKAILIR